MTDPSLRSVSIERVDHTRFRATNAAGVTIDIGPDGAFTPVELLLAAIASCGAIDIDLIVSKRAEPLRLSAVSEGHKELDEHGHRIRDIRVRFDVEFPEGEEGDRAREVLPRALQQSYDRLCTVTRTVVTGSAVDFELG